MRRSFTKIYNELKTEVLRGRGARSCNLANARTRSAFIPLETEARCVPSRFLTGFTLIEIVIVIALVVLIFGFAVGVGSDFYQSQSLIAERDTLLAVLRRARTNATNNVGQSDHGVLIAPDGYVIFEGGSYDLRNADFDENFPRGGNIEISGPAELVFSALEGVSNASGTISLENARGKIDISVNYEGRITW